MKLLNKIISHHWTIFIILAAALFLRTYRVGDLTGFYFDQGRDAKVIWDLWHSGKTFLIGPTTGIEGIFLGPFYYYLIAPFYLIGNGNPIMVSYALALINVIGIYVIYQVGSKYFDRLTGILAALLITFSLPLTQAHRWLSNPTPLPLFSALALLLIFKIINGHKSIWLWPLLGLVLGLSLQLEAASAVFFLPATLIIVLIFRKSVVWHKSALLFFIGFGLTLIPQAWFNFRHQNILVNSFERFLVSEKSFTPVLTNFYKDRLSFYYGSFSEKLFLDRSIANIFFVVFAILAVLAFKFLHKKSVTVLLIWCLTPLTLLLFYHGNNGYVWDYYFTGIFSVFFLFVAVVLAAVFQNIKCLKPLIGLLVLIFIATNCFHLHNYLFAGLNGETNVVLGTSLPAVDWVFKDAGNRQFNVDVYVPPVISHAYDYLFLWQGDTVFHRQPDTNRQNLLYLVYEVDTPHPERLRAWLDRQNTYATPEASVRFGGVTVERRLRFSP